jgi:hypothetical protein
VERESGPPGRGDEHALPPEALAGLDTDARQVIAEVIMLHREFPAWAVWLPGQGHAWTAVRPASARAPAWTCRWSGCTRRPRRTWPAGCGPWTGNSPPGDADRDASVLRADYEQPTDVLAAFVKTRRSFS